MKVLEPVGTGVTASFNPAPHKFVDEVVAPMGLQAGARSSPKGLMIPDESPDHDLPHLNRRQLVILRAVRAGESFDVQRGIKDLGVSDATISRDLGKMVELGLLQRLGKGRATVYKAAPRQLP